VRRAIAGVVVFLAALATAVGLIFGLRQAPVARTLSLTERTVVQVTNRARISRGYRELSVDRLLAAYAHQHSADMATAGYLFHTQDLGAVLKGRVWCSAGENVGVGSSVLAVHRAFMDSPDHRWNILHPPYRRLAAGAVWRDGQVWITQIFWRAC
jgi:uncharacterized protein YkwD